MLTKQAPAVSMALVVRTHVGDDDWGQPVMEEALVPFRGYFYQYGSEDTDRTGGVNVDTGKVLMMVDGAMEVRPHEWLAVDVDVNGFIRRYEIIGPPEPKVSLAQGGRIHHWELLVSRAAA